MKPVCLDLSNTDDITNSFLISSIIERLYFNYKRKITILSNDPKLYKENLYVEKSYKTTSIDNKYLKDNYIIHDINYNKENKMKRILIITPHLSTGGAPQVTLNKVILLKDHFEIKLIEYSFLSWQHVIQRNKIINILEEGINFHSLGDNKYAELISYIKTFCPDVILMEEFPEMFMSEELSSYIYSNDKSWKIFETTHDSSFKPENKRYFPDKFIFVSAYNLFKFIDIDIPAEIIEYPVDIINRNQEEMKNKLGLEFDYKHFISVGLFTPRKNQEYAFLLANKLKNYKVKIHFLGNQASNFIDYWQPLIKKKPENCIIWGERDDVIDFLQAADAFLFTSKGQRANKELNPIAIKEAMKYKDLTKVMFNLDVYCNKYNDDDSVLFLTGDAETDSINIINKLKLETINQECIILGTYPNLHERVRLTKETIKSLKPLNRKIILVSHYPVNEEIQKMVDFYIYDKNNPLSFHSYYTKFHHDTEDYFVEININSLKDTNQSPAVWTNILNGAKFAKELGFKRFFYTTYDVVIDEKDINKINFVFQSNKKLHVSTLQTPHGLGIQTNGMMFNTEFFIKEFDNINTSQEFNKICRERSSENYLEDYLAKVVFSFNPNDVQIENNDEGTLLKYSGLGSSSNSEYYSIIPVTGKHNTFMLYFFTYNIDNRIIHINIDDTIRKVFISKNREWKHEFQYKGDEINIKLEFYDEDICYKVEHFKMNNENINNFSETGKFDWKTKIKPKIKLVHLQITTDDERQKESRKSLEQVSNYGWEYVIHTNAPYTDLPPKYNCLRPDCVSMELFDSNMAYNIGTALTPSHIGCYESFKNAILSEFDTSIDFLMICEGDCIIEVPIQEFIEKVQNSCTIIEDNNIGYMSFGDKDTLEQGWLQSPIVEEIHNQDLLYITNHIIGIQSIMFPKFTRKWLKNTLLTHKWDAADIFFNIIFKSSSFKQGIVHKRLTTQADGFSLIDKTNKIFRK